MLIVMAWGGKRAEEVRVQDFRPIGLVEALDERILCGLPGLNEVERDPTGLGPRNHRARQEFRAMVHPQGAGRSMQGDELLEQGQDPAAGQRETDLDRERLPVALVQDMSVRNTRPS